MTQTALEFFTDLVKVSEPMPSDAVSPSPELVEGERDDDAFAELAAAYRETEEENERR